MVSTRGTQRDAAPPNKKKVPMKKKKGEIGRVSKFPKLPNPVFSKGVIINCKYNKKDYELMGYGPKPVETVYGLLKEEMMKEKTEELKDLPETSDGLAYIIEGKRVNRQKDLGSLRKKGNTYIDILAEKTSTLKFCAPSPSYSGGSSSSDSDDDHPSSSKANATVTVTVDEDRMTLVEDG